MPSPATRCLITCFLVLPFSSGCEQAAKGPSYAELVTIFNAENETLDRLERKRQDVVDQYQAQLDKLVPPKPSVSAPLKGLLESAGAAVEAAKSDGGDLPADPNELLDGLLNNQQAAKEMAGNLLQAISGEEKPPEMTPELLAQRAAVELERDARLAEIDSEIVAQKERVARAQAARDAAQPPK